MQRSYTIKQFEKVTGVSAHTLRYFDKVGLLSPQREPNGYRRYSVAQVAQAEMIVLLQQATCNQLYSVYAGHGATRRGEWQRG